MIKKAENSGFTLIEIIIVVSIFAMVITAVNLFAVNISKTELFFTESLDSEVELRQAYKAAISELRSIGSPVTGGYFISSASSDSFTFFSDIDNDGYAERIRYFVEGSILRKGVIKASGTPFDYNLSNEKITEPVHYLISDNIFSYYGSDYDGNQSPLNSPIDLSQIRTVKIQLTVDKDPGQLPEKISLPVYVNIRNLRGI